MNTDRASATHRHDRRKDLARRLALSSAPRKLARGAVRRVAVRVSGRSGLKCPASATGAFPEPIAYRTDQEQYRLVSQKQSKTPQAAPPAATAGAGPQFEGKVGAFYLLALISSAEPRGLTGATIRTVEFQQRGSGRPLDDVIGCRTCRAGLRGTRPWRGSCVGATRAECGRDRKRQRISRQRSN